MSEKTISTVEELKTFLKNSLSEKRYIHTLGVAQTTEKILKLYNCNNYDKEWNGFSAGCFCGLIHDIAREYPNEKLIDYCKNESVELDEDQKAFPVLTHGIVSAIEARKLIGDYPDSWFKAVCIHTVGDEGMDDLALALFIADFTEPSRSFLTDEKRDFYYSRKTIESCAYSVLSDMMSHWATKTGFKNAKASERLLSDLKKRIL